MYRNQLMQTQPSLLRIQSQCNILVLGPQASSVTYDRTEPTCSEFGGYDCAFLWSLPGIDPECIFRGWTEASEIIFHSIA